MGLVPKQRFSSVSLVILSTFCLISHTISLTLFLSMGFFLASLQFLPLTLSTEAAWNCSTLERQPSEDFYKNYITVWKLGDIEQQSSVNLLNVYIFLKCTFFPIRWYFFWHSCTKHSGKSSVNRWKFTIF